MWDYAPDVRLALDVLGLWGLMLLIRTAVTQGLVGLKALGDLTFATVKELLVPVALAVAVALASRRVLGWP